MRLVRSALLLIAASAALCSCSQFIGTCSWVVPEGNPALKVVEARKPIHDECNCINCSAPGRFLIERDAYTLEIWNGDRWYAELYVRARGKDGSILSLSSDPPELLRMAPHVPEAATRGFEYFMRVEHHDGKDDTKVLRISVSHPDGHALGVEAIRVREETRKDVSFEVEL